MTNHIQLKFNMSSSTIFSSSFTDSDSRDLTEIYRHIAQGKSENSLKYSGELHFTNLQRLDNEYHKLPQNFQTNNKEINTNTCPLLPCMLQKYGR